LLGRGDRPAESTDLAVVSAGIVIGGSSARSLTLRVACRSACRPRAERCSQDLVLGYLRTVHPTFGNIPGPALWLMNTLG
jgi:putative transport protein